MKNSRYAWLSVLLIAALALFALAGCSSGGGGEPAAPPSSGGGESTTPSGGGGTQDNQQGEQPEYHVGDAIDYEGMQITVLSVERNIPSDNMYYDPQEGNEFIKVVVRIDNTSDGPVSYNAFAWGVADSTGAFNSNVDNGDDNDALNSGELATGTLVIGAMIFEVPAGDTGLVLCHKPSLSSPELQIRL